MSCKINPLLMQTIFWISVGLFVVAAASVGLVVRKHNRMFGNEDPIPFNDMPCEDYEVSERPFIEYFN